MNRPTHVRLTREEAQQMVIDLGDAMENVLHMVEDGNDRAKVLAFDTLSLLQDQRHVLQAELADDEVTP